MTEAAEPRLPHQRIFVGFSTTDVLLSRIIRGISGAKYSHTWLCHGDELWGGAWITQADYPTVHSYSFEAAVKGWSRLSVFEIQPAFYGSVRMAMTQNRRAFEARFDIEGLVGMAVVTVARKWLHRPMRNPLRHPEELFCSEFVQLVLQATSIHPFAGWTPDTCTPEEVYEACQQHTDHFRDISGDEFRAWLNDVGVTRAFPPSLIVDDLHMS